MDKNKLIEKYTGIAERLARKHSSGKQEYDDLLGVAYEQLVLCAHKNTDSETFPGYADTSIDGKLLDYKASQRKEEHLLAVDKTDAGKFETDLNNKMDSEKLMSQFVGIQEVIANKYYLEGMSQAEISKRYGISQQRVSQILHEIKFQLRQHG